MTFVLGKRHFGIDGVTLTGRPWANSINHFVTQILLNLQPQRWDSRFTCFTRRSNHGVSQSLKDAPVEWFQPSGSTFFWRHLSLPLALRKAKVDLAWFPFAMVPLIIGTPSVVTVHDLSFMVYPELFNRRGQLYLEGMVRRAVAQAAHIVSISQFTADDLMRLLGVQARKITVIHHGFDKSVTPANSELSNGIKSKLGIRCPYFLFLDGGNARKNLTLLLKTLSQCKSDSMNRRQFVITGDATAIRQILKTHDLRQATKRQLILPGFLTKTDLEMLYRDAAALLYLSHYEGFGLPILEAFANDCPVIALRASSLPEVAGDAALFVEPGDVSQLEDAMALVEREDTRSQLIRAGRKQTSRFSWSAAADQLCQTLNRVPL